MFRITKGDKGFSNLLWVINPTKTVDKRAYPVLTCVLVDNHKIVSTDRYRVHIIDNVFNLPAGLQKIVKATTSEIVLDSEDQISARRFPEYRKVLTRRADVKDKFRIWHDAGDGNLCKMMIQFQMSFDFDYLRDILIKGMNCYKDEVNRGMLFHNQERMGIIMPLEVNKGDKDDNR